MGGGILPTTIHNGKLYFLFGKEGKYEDSAPGFADFGGGDESKETHLQTAAREASEEFTGFLGPYTEISKMLNKCGTYNLDLKSDGYNTYRTHIFPFEYDEHLPHYFNNNSKFLQNKLPPKVLKTIPIFEKIEIKWVCVDELKKMRPEFRKHYQIIIDMILNQKDNIKTFIKKCMSKCGSHVKTCNPKSKTKRNKTKRNKTKRNKTKRNKSKK
jgi:8-oxo-dGTP pyrophosphatase MutT (NUDIX family)